MTLLELALAVAVFACLVISLLWRKSLREAREEASQQSRALEQRTSSSERSFFLAERMLGQVLAHAADALVITDPERRIVHYSSGAESLFDVPADRALGKPFIEVAMDADLDRLLRACLRSRKRETTSVRLTLSHRMLEATAVPVLEGSEAPHALVIMKDVTELRKLETARREFVANISHELRVPLAAVKAMVETLLDGALSDKEASSRFLSQINSEVDNITQLVRELLELSRIESGQKELKLAPADIGAVVRNAVRRLQVQADQRQVNVSVAADADSPPGLVDEEKIEQVVLNLVHNAIKFTPAGGRVDIKVYCRPMGSARVLAVNISDTGVGIPEDELSRIFERFYKVDKARKRGEGTGLGLAIAKHIIQAHGGQIWAESNEGKGSTFTFTLPAAVVEPA